MEDKSMKVMNTPEMQSFQYAKLENLIRISNSKATYAYRNTPRKAVQPTMEWKSMKVVTNPKNADPSMPESLEPASNATFKRNRYRSGPS
jgi:hypothetical protein